MNNTIILLAGAATMVTTERKRFTKGDTIWCDGAYPKELKRWSIDKKDEAKEALSKYRCSYTEDGEIYHVIEYALEYCECDEDGEFIQGSDYDLAEEL